MPIPDPSQYEKLGAFFIGREPEAEGGEPVLLDSRDLTTHAVCVGMTGSGKTGLCIALMEEAAIDGVPVIAIDPKGDLANMALTFPGLEAADFRPWISEAEAAREGRSADEQAEAVATRWREGLAAWGQDGARIAKLRAAAEVAIWTPGSSSGRPISVLRSFSAPPPALRADEDALRERVTATASSLLALAGIEADPLRSREHVLVATILHGAWSEGRSLDLAALIGEIRTPPFERVGVVDVGSFFPEKDRFELAMAFNSLAASPGFGAWMQGEPLDVPSLLHAPDGRPRVSIVSIAHLSDAERMFVVTLLLQEIIAWMRTQPGTGSLRALLFMDEVFGFLPPVASPPSKLPMLTLLKQARAFGLGVVLATQNPVDLDYKALSNAGTWLLGRLQTERDKLRVLDGLEGSAVAAAGSIDRERADALLSGLGKRMFVLAGAHGEPVLFESRWVLSYLAGPLTRPQIRALQPGAGEPAAPPAPAASALADSTHPLLPPGVEECYLSPAGAADGELAWRPRLLARARLHHVAPKLGVDAWRDLTLLAALPQSADDAWEPEIVEGIRTAPAAPQARHEALPVAVTAASMTAWSKSLAQHLVTESPLTLLRCEALDAVSQPGESEGAFRGWLAHEARERRDAGIAELRRKHEPRALRLQERLRKAAQRVEVQRGQAAQQRTGALVSAGGALLGALFGRRGSALGKAGTVARGFGRASQESQDVARAESDVEAAREEAARLEAELQEGIAQLDASLDPAALVLSPVSVPARKSDASCSLTLCWTPWSAGADGLLRPA
jgi:hypothetical protein